MRSILTFVIVVAIALGLYTFLSKDDGEATKTAPQKTYQAPTTQRPQIGKPGTGGTVQGGDFTVDLPDDMEARLEAGVFSWQDTVSDDYLVRMEDAWDVDVMAVDFSKDLLCRVDGVDITRDDLRSWICLKYGQGAINPRIYAEFGRMAAAKTGVPYGMSDAQWDVYFADWLAQKGVDKDYALANLALQLRVPMEAVEGIRRDMVEAVLAFFPPVESADELPLGLADSFTSDEQMVQASSLGLLMRETITRLSTDQGRIDAPISGLVEPMSMLFATGGEEMRFRRTWTSLMGDMPAGVLVSIFKGEMEGDGILPPWEYQGDRAQITIDEIWDLLAPGVQPALMRSELRDVIWSKVLQAKLAASGHLPGSREIWLQFADDYLAHKMAFFSLDFVLSESGYPSRSFYLNDLRITKGFADSQPAGWDSEENLRAFFDKNGFFVMGWQPDLELALFVPRDPREGLDTPENWGQALAGAEAFRARVEAGESFTELRSAHNRALVEAYRDLNQGMGDAFALEFGNGEFKTTMAMVNQVLSLSLWRDHIDATSPLRNAVIRLDEGEVSPPWKTPVGYIVVRMNGAQLSKLEREYEDVIDFTKAEFTSWALRKWVTEQLSGMTVELP